MDFIERWLHISPDGGNGASELLIATIIILAIISLAAWLRGYLPKSFTAYLKQLGKRGNSDRFDN